MGILSVYTKSHTYSIPEFLYVITHPEGSTRPFKRGDAMRIIANDKSAVTLPLYITYSYEVVPESIKHKLLYSSVIDIQGFSLVLQGDLKECIELAHGTAHVFCNKIHSITHYHDISYDNLRQREVSLVLEPYLTKTVVNLIVEFVPATWEEEPTFEAFEFGVEKRIPLMQG